ncbi:MAG: hypothetical protein IJ695_04455 [Butyrivibrio sp.]|nr:hypothetical protein [Butyrivibrio sp.]
MKSKKGYFFSILITILSLSAISYLLYELIANNGIYPSGEQTWFYIYRGNLIYKALMRGEIYPLFDSAWYNGIQPLRFTSPLALFLLAFCNIAAYGQIYVSYIFFCIVLFILGQISFTICGFIAKRPVSGAVIGAIYFFCPTNIYMLFAYGDLAISLCLCFVPLLLCLLITYLDSGRSRALFGAIIVFCLIILSHTGFSALLFLFIILYLLLQRFFFRNRRRMVKTITGLVISYAICGIFVLPLVEDGYDFERFDRARQFFQSILITLNPLYRVDVSAYMIYFGISLVIISVLGILVSNKRSAPGFLVAIVLVLVSTPSAYEMIKVIPGAEALWMMLLLPVGSCMVLLSVLYWKKLRKWIFAAFILIICIDSLPSLYFIYGNHNRLQPFERFKRVSENTYIDKAKELCGQRIALIDLGTLGGEAAYIISNYAPVKNEVFGIGYETAKTADNVSRINMAMADEYYDYMFDRLLMLGADTVIIQKEQAVYGESSLIKLDRAAENNGFDILYENGDYMLYKHKDLNLTFGTKAVYDAIGIGYSAYSLSLAFPNIKEATDDYLDHYTYEELSKYKVVYLSGFYYEDREVAEDLVQKLSQNGVRVVILADGMPEDRESRTKTFLGVTCNVIQFENGYPILYTDDFGELDCDLFPRDYSKWITYYLNGLGDVRGTIYDNEIELAFMGTGINENICYVGLNIPFYYYLTKDKNAGNIMQWVMGMDAGQLPDRSLIPYELTTFNGGMIINSTEDNLNTSISYQDIFRSDQTIGEENNLLTVNKGTTIISYAYPYLFKGLLVTVAGFAFCAIFMSYVSASEKRDREKNKRLSKDSSEGGGQLPKESAETDTDANKENRLETDSESYIEQKTESVIQTTPEMEVLETEIPELKQDIGTASVSKNKSESIQQTESETEFIKDLNSDFETGFNSEITSHKKDFDFDFKAGDDFDLGPGEKWNK